VVYCSCILSGPISLCSKPSFILLINAPPVLCTMHFGTPVVPLEYTITNGSRNATLSNVNSSLPSAASKNAVNFTAFSTSPISHIFSDNLPCTTNPSNSATPLIPSTISFIFGRKSMVFPLYTAQSSKKTNLGRICRKRSSIPLLPISVELLENSAPKLSTAINTMNESKLVPATSATRSPFFNPFARNAFASLPILRLTSPKVMCFTSTFPSRISVNAILSSSLPTVVVLLGSCLSAEKSTFSAKLRYVPSNQCGILSMGAEVSTTVV
jgi:hypothetical protein